jgi:hypothetical protein
MRGFCILQVHGKILGRFVVAPQRAQRKRSVQI